MKIAVISNASAGFMAAIATKESGANTSVTFFERIYKFFSKVKISEGFNFYSCLKKSYVIAKHSVL